jgi:TatD DNase family protein
VRLIDSHAHLQAAAFAEDVATIVATARRAGVERLLAPGWDLASTRAGIALSREHSLLTSAGIHPHVAGDAGLDQWREIEVLAQDACVAAIGETGLDYDRAFSSRPDQLANLRRHIELALRLGKPLILHCRSKPGERSAQDDLLAELAGAGIGDSKDFRRSAQFRGPPAVLHSFSGPVDYGERALEMGCAISFSGLVFRRGEEASAEVARIVPGERLLVETDSPYLSPPGAPKRRNEPRWVEVTARWVAEQRREDPELLGQGLVPAFDRLFPAAASPAKGPERLEP